jgi:hypothetical protein
MVLCGTHKYRTRQQRKKKDISVAKSAPARFYREVIALGYCRNVEVLPKQRVGIGIVEKQDATLPLAGRFEHDAVASEQALRFPKINLHLAGWRQLIDVALKDKR